MILESYCKIPYQHNSERCRTLLFVVFQQTLNPLPSSSRNFSICLTSASSRSDSIIGLSSGIPRNSNTYGSFTISSGFAISFPFKAKSSTFCLFASPFDRSSLSNKDEDICLLSSRTLHLELMHSTS